MVRMTDLLKKAKGKSPDSKEQSKDTKEERSGLQQGSKDKILHKDGPATRSEDLKGVPSGEEKTPPRKKVSFAGMLSREKQAPSKKEADFTQTLMKDSIEDEEEAKKLYFDAVEFTKKVFAAYRESNTIDEEAVNSICQKIVNSVLLGSRVLVKLFHELDSEDSFIYHNAVNVCVLSVGLGVVLKLNKSALLDLAIVGLLHDIELIKREDLIGQPRKLRRKELTVVKQHPVDIATYLDSAFNFNEELLQAILQHHERKAGQGYPDGLLESEIKEMSSIVGIVDTYEAMTHSRPYKTKIPASSAVLDIINNGKKLFPNKVIKALVSCVGVYPIGSMVEINTGEIARVLENNIDFPLRPVISVIMDRHANKLEQVRTVDLLHAPSFYIKKVVEHLSGIENEGGD